MNLRFASVTILCVSVPLWAAQYNLELKPESTKIQWTLGDVLHVVHGTFDLRRGNIGFDSETGKASGQIVVDVASGNSGSAGRDRRMHASVLESDTYPAATFVPDHIEGAIALAGSSTFKVHGQLTIHGTPHEITMDVHAISDPNRIHTKIDFAIPYVAWGFRNPSTFILKVNKTVDVAIEADGALVRR